MAGVGTFLRTLKEELIPFIESKYRVTSDRGLAGYSFGGLFAAWVLVSGDDTFSRYLIGSPSLWWDHGLIQKNEAALAASGNTLRGRVFLSVGADEGNSMVPPFKALTAALASRAYPDLRLLESYIFDSTDHLSGASGTYSRGLKVLYGRPQSSSQVSPPCDGDYATVRVSTIKPGAMQGFLAAVAAQKAWYRSHGFSDNIIVASRVISTNEATKAREYSETEVVTYHIRPPAGVVTDDAWDAYGKRFRDTSDIKSEYRTCMPKLVP